MTTPADRRDIPPSIGYTLKRKLLGKPLTSEHLDSERLSNPVALGAIAPDAISSTAYGPEQIMIELLPNAGMAAFVLLLPITGVLLVILLLVTASYRGVVMLYTRAGGAYMVARDNFGPRVAQIAAAALLIDYVVTVAVQPAAGTTAVVSAIPVLRPYHLELTIGFVILICFLNLRGVRQSGRTFAVTTYFFVGMMSITILTGFVRESIWGLPKYVPLDGAVPIHQGSGLVMGATVLVLLRAFANGGTSLTGVEAISNTVDVFSEPKGRNARRVLTQMALILGFLLGGVAWLAHVTHATPYLDEYPSMLSEIAHQVFGGGVIGNVLYFLVQTSSALILFTGANTGFNGFPALASFVAGDRFLPRQLTKRGHRLVYSNGIILLAALAIVLLLVTGGSITALVPFFAIGVFTAFSMAGYGLAKHYRRERGPGWLLKYVTNISAGMMSTFVVGVFVVAKFTEGAWLVVVIFPILVYAFIRLNRQYRAEASVLETSQTEPPEFGKHERLRVFLLVDTIDLAEIEALRYGKGLHADELCAVHFVIDVDHANELRDRWNEFNHDVPLRLVDCPDRHLSRAAQELVLRTINDHPDTKVTVLLPRRTYSAMLGRLLHDRTADRMARAISRITYATAIIVPYDVGCRLALVNANGSQKRVALADANGVAKEQSSATTHATIE